MADDLDAQFRALGVSEPEEWASSQRNEGIDQLSRATILRELARMVVALPYGWDAQTGHRMPEVRAAATRLAEKDIDRRDIQTLLHATAYDLVFDILCLLDGSSELEVNPGNIHVGLQRLDVEEFEPIGSVHSLHESWNEVAATFIGENIVEV